MPREQKSDVTVPDPSAVNHGGLLPDRSRRADARGPAVIHFSEFADALDRFNSEPERPVMASTRPVGSVPAVWATAEPAHVSARRERSNRRLAEAAAAALILIAALGYARRTVSPTAFPAAPSEAVLPSRPLAVPFAPALDAPQGQALRFEVDETITGREPTPEAERPAIDVAVTPRPLMLPVADGAFSPSFDPTGSALLFHSGRKRTGRLLEMVVEDRGTSSAAEPATMPIRAVPVPGEAANNYHPRVSPDGRLIAFDSDRDGDRGVYIADRNGADATRVSGDGFAAVPSWSPDMRRLAFLRAEPNQPRVWNLWLCDLASGTLMRQTSFRVGQVWSASWFPDARRLSFSHEDRLVILDTVTGASDSFPTPRPGRLVRTPAVSPDGRRIIFQVYRDGVWLLDLQTRAMRRIMDDATAEEFAWDPKGQRIAYHSRRDGQWRIWMASLPSS